MYVYGFESYQVNKLECLLLGRFNLVRIKLSPPISSFFYSSSIILPPSIYIETLDSFDLLFCDSSQIKLYSSTYCMASVILLTPSLFNMFVL